MNSFISTYFIDKSRVIYDKTSNELSMSCPFLKTLSTNHITKDIRLQSNGEVRDANLYLLEMKDFGILLGIDWLGSNHTIIQCHKKEVVTRE